MPIHLELVTQEEKVFEEPEADIVLVPAVEGEMGVLPNHAPVLTTLGFGELIVRKGAAEERFAVYGGVVDVRPDKVVVLADLAESSFALDLEKAQEAREQARQALDDAPGEAENREAIMALRRANLAVRISQKIRSRGPGLRILDEESDEF
ncbi:MAG: ATP synthase F1 subunit epsilon [Chloroflexota bacterium]|nr:ATP synthase F1 subunit epsilon [Chloroflexota bacterium]MDE2853289.1 ATP synthase F1 subunit epsilon [Chloroflexota bacterium]MDE2948196.1 ATP synthase F1 subunit epsilon [Chloroflexota bacterium]